MRITITCPVCSRTGTVPAAYAYQGRRVRCPHCRRSFTARPAAHKEWHPVPFTEMKSP